MTKSPEKIAREIEKETGVPVSEGFIEDIQKRFVSEPLREAIERGLVGKMENLVKDDERELRKMFYKQFPKLRGKIDLRINTEPRLEWKRLEEIA